MCANDCKVARALICRPPVCAGGIEFPDVSPLAPQAANANTCPMSNGVGRAWAKAQGAFSPLRSCGGPPSAARVLKIKRAVSPGGLLTTMTHAGFECRAS